MKLMKFAVVLAAAVALIVAVGCSKKAAQTESAAVVEDDARTGAEWFEEGNDEEAGAYFEGVLQEDSTDVDALVYMSRIALREDDSDGAIQWIEKALALAPDSSNVHYWAATAYVVKVQRENAFQLVGKVKTHIDTAVELDPSNVEARMFLAGFLLNAPPMVGGSPEKAREQADIIVELDPFRGHMFWAETHKKNKNWDEAAAEYKAAAAIDPQSAAPWYSLGMMYQGAENYDGAFTAFEKALEVDPEATNSLYQIGRTGVISGGLNMDRSIAALKEYLGTPPPAGQPTPANAHWRLGMLYELKGGLDMARAEFEAALALDPDDKQARKALENLGTMGEGE